MEINKNDEPKVYEKNRFEFSIFVNENLVCKRNFKINNFSEIAFKSLDFKDTMNNIVSMIDSDLKSKSRLYTWYRYDENCSDDEFSEPLIPEWESTLKIIITDNDKEVFSQIWDGRFYPRDIRQNVDIINKYMQVGNYQNGDPIMSDITKIDKNRLDIEHYINYIIYSHRTNLVDLVIKKICEVCSPEKVYYQDGKLITEGKYSNDSDYTINDDYGDKKYNFLINQAYRSMVNGWRNKLSKKTERYFHEECNDMFTNNLHKKTVYSFSTKK